MEQGQVQNVLKASCYIQLMWCVVTLCVPTPSTSSALKISEDKEEDPDDLRPAEEGVSLYRVSYDRSIASSKVSRSCSDRIIHLLAVQPKYRGRSKSYLYKPMWSIQVPSDNLEFFIIWHLSSPIQVRLKELLCM
jgi:hypothetical protein